MNLPTIHWPHVLACLLVAVTAVLLCFGALVTTYDAAMAVPDWPGTFGHNMFLYPLQAWLWGPWDLFLEHGHRLLGALVGVITLGMAAAVWRRETDATLRALAIAAVMLVVVQECSAGPACCWMTRPWPPHKAFSPRWIPKASAACASCTVATATS